MIHPVLLPVRFVSLPIPRVPARTSAQPRAHVEPA
jgi:hypothetical protein